MNQGDGYTIAALRENPRLEQISYGEAQTRIQRLADLDARFAGRNGKRSAWVVSPAGLETLVRLREIEKSGLSLDAALEMLRKELSNGSKPSPQPREEDAHISEALEMLKQEVRFLRERVADLEAQRDDCRAERDRILGLAERVTLILPAPSTQRRGWFRRGLTRHE